MRTLRMIWLLVAAAVAVGLSGCRGDDTAEASAATFEAADKYAISELQTRFHEANSTKNLELVVSLFADDALLTLAGQTYSGREQIRNFFANQAGPFKPENRWTSLHPAFKVRITAVEDRGTVHFECHYVDVDTSQFKSSVQADGKVARVDGRWVFTSMVASNATL